MAEIYGFKVNGTTYRYDYNYLANKPAGLPEYDNGDCGKVLAVNDTGELEWQSIGNEENSSDSMLPSVENADAGDVLMVTSESDDISIEWRQLLPPHSDDNNDCALMVKEGSLEWEHLIPGWSSDDIGSVLTINESGEMQWLPLGT